MSNEDPKYIKMLAQMGLKPEVVPADLKQTIMDKLGLSKTSEPKKARSNSGERQEKQHDKKERVDKPKHKSKKNKEAEKKNRDEQTKLGQLKEEDLHFASNANDKLTLVDLFTSLNPEAEEKTINSTKLHKQFKSLEKEALKAPVL